MKNFATNLTVLLAVAAASLTVSSSPSLAADPLHLLAQVNHIISEDANTRLEDVAKDQKKKASTPSTPTRPQ